MMLKYHNERIVDIDDFDSLVENTYGKPYSFQQQDGCKPRGFDYFTAPEFPEENPDDEYEGEDLPTNMNDEMGVAFSTWLETPVNEHKRLFWERNYYPSLEMIVNDLTRKGLIEPGKYIINIDW